MDLYQCRNCHSFLRLKGMVKEDPRYGLSKLGGGVCNPCYYNCQCGKLLIYDPDDGQRLTLSPNVKQTSYSGKSDLYWYGQASCNVNYGKTVKALLAEGKYEKGSFDVNDHNFPQASWEEALTNREVTFKLFYLPQPMEFEEVVMALGQEDCRGACLREGLTFCNEKPHIHKKVSMFTPGSFWRDDRTACRTREIPRIDKSHSVFLRQLDCVYPVGTLFLAVAL